MPEQPGEPMLADLAVVVVAYGPVDLLERCLVGVARGLAPAQVIVVDNFSTPQARADVRALCRRQGWRAVLPATNTGFGRGCNLGVAEALRAGARHVLLLNPDATIDRASVARLLDAVAAEPLLLAAPTVCHPDGRVASAGLDVVLRTGRMRPWRRRAEDLLQDPRTAAALPWVTGACLLLSAELWQRCGGLSEDYFLYWEDVDLCARVRAAGGRVAVVAGATAVHEGGSTQAPAPGHARSAAYYYFNIRNRQLFAATWLPPQQRRRWRRTSPGAAWEVLLRGGRRQLLHPVVPLRAAWRGLRDGDRLLRRGAAPGALADPLDWVIPASGHDAPGGARTDWRGLSRPEGET
jgi:GT2 family glycosyltransferase